MTAAEKAKDLVGRYLIMDTHDEDSFIIRKHRAMQCALIAVDEILYELDHIPASNETREYWEEVKREIEKL